MLFKNVSIIDVAHVDAPVRVSSDVLEAPLWETYQRLGAPRRLIEPLTGVRERRFWNRDTQPSDAATLAGKLVLEKSGVDSSRVGVLINASVCRDYVEPSVACFVHRNLGLGETCLNFDASSACLGFIEAMQIIGNMIERGQVELGLIVDGESSRFVVEQTVARLAKPTCDAEMLREQLATLTVGSGAAAMILGHARAGGHAFIGASSLAATEHNQLCRGQLDVGLTDTKGLLIAGVSLARRTWVRAQAELGWTTDVVDDFVLHQVSELHTRELARTLEFDLAKAPLIYPELGNVGPASVPIALAKAIEMERISPGDRVILGGIGSGLNCTAAGVIW